MAFGVTSAGFLLKRLAVIKTELEQKYRSTFGANADLDPRGPLGQKLALEAEDLSKLWELAQATYNSYIPSNAKGIQVDNQLSVVGLRRKNATASTVNLKYFGSPGTIIDTNVQVSRFDVPSTIFENTTQGTIVSGTGTNEQKEITFSGVPDGGDWELTYDGEASVTLAFNISAAQLQVALENISTIGVGNIAVTGDFSTGFTFDFQGTLAENFIEPLVISDNNLVLGANAVTATGQVLVSGELPNITLPAQATETGPLTAVAGTVTTIVVSAAGLDSVTNLFDAEVGSDVESDAEALTRRNESVAIPGHSTLPAIRANLLQIDGVTAARIFENDTSIEIDGRPPKSWEAVVQGGDDDAIFAEVLDGKAGGIQTVGTLSKVLKDSNGFDKTVFFSRPTAIPIYLIVDIKTNAGFPLDGAAQAASNLLAYGDSLNIGDDIIIFTNLVCSLDGISGIIDVDVRLGAQSMPAVQTQVCTFVNVATNLTVDLPAHGLQDLNRVQFSTDGVLPAGLSPGQLYFVRNATANQFGLSVARTSEILSFINAGTGTHSVTSGGFEENLFIGDDERADFDSSRIIVNQV